MGCQKALALALVDDAVDVPCPGRTPPTVPSTLDAQRATSMNRSVIAYGWVLPSLPLFLWHIPVQIPHHTHEETGIAICAAEDPTQTPFTLRASYASIISAPPAPMFLHGHRPWQRVTLHRSSVFTSPVTARSRWVSRHQIRDYQKYRQVTYDESRLCFSLS